jgi:hypothetical protein
LNSDNGTAAQIEGTFSIIATKKITYFSD